MKEWAFVRTALSISFLKTTEVVDAEPIELAEVRCPCLAIHALYPPSESEGLPSNIEYESSRIEGDTQSKLIVICFENESRLGVRVNAKLDVQYDSGVWSKVHSPR